MSNLRRDVASLKDTFARLAAKTLVSELEGTARRNPLATIAGTAGRCHHWDDVAGTQLMFAALRSALRDGSRPTLLGALALAVAVGLLAGRRLTDHRAVRRTR
jgi:hypothetical protein